MPATILAIVVVAKDSKLAHRSLQFGKYILPALGLFCKVVDKVASKQDNIGIGFVDQLNGFLRGSLLVPKLPICRSEICAIRIPSKPSGRLGKTMWISDVEGKPALHTSKEFGNKGCCGHDYAYLTEELTTGNSGIVANLLLLEPWPDDPAHQGLNTVHSRSWKVSYIYCKEKAETSLK